MFDYQYISTSYDIPHYRNLFNGQEADNEVYGDGAVLGYEFRQYDARIGRWWSVDPMSDKYPGVSPYVFCNGSPIVHMDLKGGITTIPPWIIGIKSLALILEKRSSQPMVKTVSYSINHPINALRVKYDYNVAATNFQVNIGKAIKSPQNTEGSPQNAIRHTLWQALITRDIGSKQAERIGAAHEDNTPVDINQRDFTSLSKADKVADLLNNQIGRKIGETNTFSSNKDIAKLVMKEYFDNGLWTARGNEKDGYKLVRTKITEDQYKSAIIEINKKGENGLEQ